MKPGLRPLADDVAGVDDLASVASVAAGARPDAERATDQLDTLAAFAEELERRLPGYLRRQPLRLLAGHPLASDCAAIARAWSLPLVEVGDDAELTSVDRYLQARLASGPPAGRHALGPAALAERHALHFAERAARDAREAELSRATNTLTVPEVPGLRYTALGHGGPPVVAINALGQTTLAWLPLLAELSRHRRVLVWEQREHDAAGRPLTFAEHCADLRAILDAERADSCHLVGWCTGAKLAMRTCRLHPERVASVVWLAGSFKHPNRAPALDTRYERNLEAMLYAVDRQPALAERLRGVLSHSAASDASSEAALTQLEPEALAQRLLSEVPAALMQSVRRPFRSGDALRVYARQHLEIWSHDETAPLPIPRPILALSGALDRIVSPEAVRSALGRFASARFELYTGATHYLLFERAAEVAIRIEKWIATAQECANVTPQLVVRSSHDE